MSTRNASKEVARVLSTKHARLLLSHVANHPQGDRLLTDLVNEINQRSRSRLQRCLVLVGKAILLLSLLNVCSILLFGHFPALWQRLQNTETYSRAELEFNQILRQITVGLGLHNWELLHARERDRCLVPNPFYRNPLRCCPCDKQHLRVSAIESAAPLRASFDKLFDRMVGPFAYPNNSQTDVSFSALQLAVKSNWDAMALGSNRLRVLWPAQQELAVPAPSLESLFEVGDAPPENLAIVWHFGHLPAIRALRGLVRRPDHVPELTEDTLARQLLFLGTRVPANKTIPLGDFREIRGLAYAITLHGVANIHLTLKSECCSTSEEGMGMTRHRLHSGDVLGFMTDCYWVSAEKQEDAAPEYAILYFGSVFNGVHPIEAKSARRSQSTTY